MGLGIPKYFWIRFEPESNDLRPHCSSDMTLSKNIFPADAPKCDSLEDAHPILSKNWSNGLRMALITYPQPHLRYFEISEKTLLLPKGRRKPFRASFDLTWVCLKKKKSFIKLRVKTLICYNFLKKYPRTFFLYQIVCFEENLSSIGYKIPSPPSNPLYRNHILNPSHPQLQFFQRDDNSIVIIQHVFHYFPKFQPTFEGSCVYECVCVCVKQWEYMKNNWKSFALLA